MRNRVAEAEFALNVFERRRTRRDDELQHVGRTRDGAELVVGFPAYRVSFPAMYHVWSHYTGSRLARSI
jgi:hypothetical protein